LSLPPKLLRFFPFRSPCSPFSGGELSPFWSLLFDPLFCPSAVNGFFFFATPLMSRHFFFLGSAVLTCLVSSPALRPFQRPLFVRRFSPFASSVIFHRLFFSPLLRGRFPGNSKFPSPNLLTPPFFNVFGCCPFGFQIFLPRFFSSLKIFPPQDFSTLPF